MPAASKIDAQHVAGRRLAVGARDADDAHLPARVPEKLCGEPCQREPRVLHHDPGHIDRRLRRGRSRDHAPRRRRQSPEARSRTPSALQPSERDEHRPRLDAARVVRHAAHGTSSDAAACGSAGRTSGGTPIATPATARRPSWCGRSGRDLLGVGGHASFERERGRRAALDRAARRPAAARPRCRYRAPVPSTRAAPALRALRARQTAKSGRTVRSRACATVRRRPETDWTRHGCRSLASVAPLNQHRRQRIDRSAARRGDAVRRRRFA